MGRPTNEINVRVEDGEENPSEKTDVLRARVERTRAEVKETITNIQARLSPDRLKQEVRDATVGKVEDMAQSARYTARRWGGNVTDIITQNPVPVALIGLGLAWLLKAKSDESHEAYLPEYSRSTAYRNPYDPYVDRESSRLEELQIKAGETAQALKARVEGAAETVQGKVGETAQTIQQSASELSGRVKGQVEGFSTQVQHRAGELKDQVQERTRRAKRGFDETFQESPWGVGAMAFAVGAAVGLSAPGTRQEDEWMGEARDTLVDQARNKAQEIGDKVVQATEKVQETATEKAKEELQKQGLTSEFSAHGSKA